MLPILRTEIREQLQMAFSHVRDERNCFKKSSRRYVDARFFQLWTACVILSQLIEMVTRLREALAISFGGEREREDMDTVEVLREFCESRR